MLHIFAIFKLSYLDWSIVCPDITEWWDLFKQEIFGVPLIMLVKEGSEYYIDEAYPCWGKV
jgi:hypothetical protein